LRPNPFQPRKKFDAGELDELTQSVKEKGILQPVLVRPIAGQKDAYQIVAGERRWRAAQRAAIHDMPVIIRELSDLETLEIALIENVQRTDLNIMEEAEGYKALIDHFRRTQEELADEIGKSRSYVANTLRLLTLPDDVQEHIRNGDLTAGHGRAILQAKDPEALARQILADGLTVREAESRARGGAPSRATSRARTPVEKDADTLALEHNVSDALGLKVSIDYRGDNGGEVRVSYKTLEQLDEICRRLTRES
jgi:ParB family chromosome partitioning protein